MHKIISRLFLWHNALQHYTYFNIKIKVWTQLQLLQWFNHWINLRYIRHHICFVNTTNYKVN
jgi:hypothetical protein